MKKYICLTLTMIILLCSIPHFAYSDTEYDKDMYDFYAKTLSALNIPVDDISAVEMTDKVSYADFTKLLNGYIGTDGSGEGYINKNLKDSVTTISYNDTVKALVSLLGWNVGTQPQEYMSIADKVGLTGGVVNTDKGFCKYDMVVLLYNSLTADMLEQRQYGDIYEHIETNNTLANKYKKAIYFDGRLVADKYGRIDNKYDVNDAYIMISDRRNGIVSLKNDIADTYSMLGMRAEGFYTYNEEGSENKLVSFTLSRKSDYFKLDYTNKPFYNKSKNRIEYTENGREKYINLKYNTDVVYNGEGVLSNTADILTKINNRTDGALNSIIISNYNDSEDYCTIAIRSYRAMVVDGKSNKEIMFFSEDNQILSFDDAKDVSYVDAAGLPIKYADINAGDTISIFEGKLQNKKTRIIVNKKIVNGQVKNTDSDGADYLITVEHTDEENKKLCEYEFAYTDLKEDLKVGEYYDFYFDHTGRIINTVQKEGGRKHYGLFVKIEPKGGMYGENEFNAMIMTRLGESDNPQLEVVSLAKKAKYNDVEITKNNYGNLNLELFHTVVTYYDNYEGSIREIYGADYDKSLVSKNRAPALSTENDIPNVPKLVLNKATCAYFSVSDADIKNGYPYTHILFGKYDSAGTSIMPHKNCKIIGVPDISPSALSEIDLNDFYKSIPFSDYEYFHYTSNAENKVTGYYEDGAIVPKFVVYSMPKDYKPADDKQMIWTDKIILVNSVKSVMNPVTETECLKIDALYGGKRVDMYTRFEGILDYAENGAENISISEGDIILPEFDANGFITYGLMYYDYNPDRDVRDGAFPAHIEDGTFDINLGYSGLYELLTTYFAKKGYVYNETADGNSIIIAEDFDAMETRDMDKMFGCAIPIKHIYTYDVSEKDADKRAAKGKMNAGTSYIEDKTNVSTAVIRYRSGSACDVVIYK